ncbi:MAG: hypothetical protein OXC26_20640 [Albidovulum sp.]|nr:hypothetical protein [Albidovulum sp.]
MRIDAKYSHLNGVEWLKVHAPTLLNEVEEVGAAVNAESCKTKVSKEKTMLGRSLYSPKDMNKAYKVELEALGREQRKNTFWVTEATQGKQMYEPT